jgi:hypothetical protein
VFPGNHEKMFNRLMTPSELKLEFDPDQAPISTQPLHEHKNVGERPFLHGHAQSVWTSCCPTGGPATRSFLAKTKKD